MPAYLKALVAGAGLLLLGVALLIRKFRGAAAARNRRLEELQTTNEKLTSALAAARSESEAKTQFLGHLGNLLGGQTRIAEQLIDFSRLESGDFQLQSIEFQPSMVVTAALDRFRPAAEVHGIETEQ
jgi:signal transduction histidine kinase